MKKKAPKPSELLRRSLELLGPKGENWITEAENITQDAGFLYRGERLNEERGIASIIDEFTDVLQNEGDIVKAAKKLQKEFKRVGEQETFCSIGAIKHINTPNEQKAANYLARTIDPSFKPDENGYQHEGAVVVDTSESIITTWNDEQSDFKPIKKIFLKAIRLAESEGH